ncbi:MAG: NUDIX domain-containing protein [Bacteroidales bacterium]|nr:NUDIX domain-containing protein [Bacteroidales bacterium]
MKLSYKHHTLDVPLSLLRLLKRRIRWIRAGGGIVTAPDGQMLLILRNGRWDLPKGKVEPGEALLQAALREVQEETGVSCLKPQTSDLRPIKTYHIFNLYGGWHLKQTSWFAMTADKQSATPQEEEGITDVVWVDPDEWYRRLQSSYGTLKTLSTLWKSSRR